MVGWVAPSMTVADGTMDCDSVVVCAARWSLMASGDGMAYSSGLCYGGLPVMVGWVASWWPLPTAHLQSYRTLSSDFSCQTVLLCVQFFCVCTKHALPV